MLKLSDCRLYGILDLSYVSGSELTRVTRALVEGGGDLIQLRAKKSALEEVVDLARVVLAAAGSVALIVNDHAVVAAKVPVAGIHVGQDDDAVALARKKAGRPIIVGKSTHSVEQAIAAQKEGADYIGFGPIFATPTKPDYAPIGLGEITRVHAEVSLPIFCIGGINIDNLQQVIDAGANRVVMVSALLRAHNIVDYARCATDMLA